MLRGRPLQGKQEWLRYPSEGQARFGMTALCGAEEKADSEPAKKRRVRNDTCWVGAPIRNGGARGAERNEEKARGRTGSAGRT